MDEHELIEIRKRYRAEVAAFRKSIIDSTESVFREDIHNPDPSSIPGVPDDDEIYRVKSNALDGLAAGVVPEFGWASFSGKTTYLEPGWDEPEGNHEFMVDVEDRNEPGTGEDLF